MIARLLRRQSSEPELEDEEDGSVCEMVSMHGLESQPKGGKVVFNGTVVDESEGLDMEGENCVRRCSLGWITRLIRVGYRKKGVLETGDLWKLRKRDDPQLVASLLGQELERRRKKGKNTISWWSFFCACFSVHRRAFIVSGLLELTYNALRFVGPILLRLIVLALEDGTANSWYGYTLAFGLFVGQVLSSLCQAHSKFISFEIGLSVKNAVSMLVFEHVLKRGEGSAGKVVNLVSTDAQMSIELMRMFHRFWTAPLVLVACIAYIYVYVGVSIFFGLILLVLFVPISIKFGKVQTTLQKEKMIQTDARVKQVNETLQGIQVLKMNAWESALLTKLHNVRAVEMKAIRTLQYYRGFTVPFAVAIPNIASVITFVAYILMGNQVTPADTFTVISAFVILRAPFATLPMAITLLTRAIVSASRIGSFLSLPTLEQEKNREGGESEDQVVVVQAKNACYAWGEPATFKLRFDFAIPKGELVAVIGRVGDGKSSLLSALLGEMNKISGSTSMRGSVALCTQEPFIMNRTVRENILFESSFHQDWYNDTLEACALVGDLETLPSSDLTEIGERGINLSGGQKARISLARAVYSRPDIILLDDPLSAVDVHVGKHIFDHCISNNEGSMLNSCTRILVTNQLYLLDQVDRILLFQDGELVEQTTQVLEKDGPIRRLFQKYSAAAAEEEKEKGKEKGKEKKKESKRKINTTLKSAMGKSMISIGSLAQEQTAKHKGALVQQEGREKGRVKFETVAAYLLAGSLNSWILTGIIFSWFLAAEAMYLSIDTWLALYSQQPTGGGGTSEDRFLAIYGGLTIAFFTILMIRAAAYAAFNVQASRVLYKRLQENVFYLPMAFFWRTPMGRVLNRLSKDTNDIDIFLPQVMQWTIMTLVRVLGIFILISFTVPVFLIAVLPFFLLYFFIREYYRYTAVSVQRIEAVLRSPIYSHLSETLLGSTTIKAFGRSVPWMRIANVLVGTNHRAYFAMEAVQTWLALRLEVLGALIVFSTAVCVVAADTAPGLAGLAIAYSLNVIVNLNFCVQTMTQTESKLNAVERVTEYSSIDNEKKLDKLAKEEENIPQEWPRSGRVQFQSATLKYRADLEPALDNLTLDIASGERVGIVGKTGAGKSTLTALCLRMHPLASGRVLIDGMDISMVPVHRLRSSISSVPQSPIIYSGTLRSNIDPFDMYTDEQINAAIEKAYLKKTLDALPNGINSQITEGGENLSVGQRQLLCIARAILRNSKLVLLDESTANLDNENDALIQKTFQTCFGQDCTIFIVAHRLATVCQCDKILVLENGQLGEFDTPANLCQQKDGIFKGMVESNGPAVAQQLKSLMG